MEMQSGDGQCETRFAGCEWCWCRAEGGDGGGRERTQPTVLRITPVLVVQHKCTATWTLHAGSALSEGKRCSS